MNNAADYIVVLNACVFVVVLWKYYKRHGVDIYTFLLFVWTASVLTSVAFFFINTFRDYSSITFLPLAVLSILLFISFKPIAKFRTAMVERVYLNNNGILIVIGYTFVVTYALYWLTNKMIPMRVSEKSERIGLDKTQHNEEYGTLVVERELAEYH